MAVADKVLAGLVLAVCLALLVRLALKPQWRYRFDQRARNVWQGIRRTFSRATQRKPARAPSPEEAAKVAEEAIRRAQEGSWRGNVYTPKSFKKPPRKPH